MRNRLLALTTFGLLMTASVSHASTIYNVNRTIGAGTVTGFIETDGTLGVLNAGNFTDWNFTLFAPNLNSGPVDVIDFATQNQTSLAGNAVVATSTEITFDFSATSAFLQFQGGISFNFWCLQTDFTCSVSGTTSESEFIAFPVGFSPTAAQNVDRLGLVTIGTVAPVPLPAAFPLFAGGLGLLGLLGWRRKRLAAAAA